MVRKRRKWRFKPNYNNGYVWIIDENTGNYVLEHRVLMEKQLGRKLTEFEEVHHIDHCKTNNSIDNLIVCSRRQHRKLERIEYRILNHIIYNLDDIREIRNTTKRLQQFRLILNEHMIVTPKLLKSLKKFIKQ